MRCFVVTDMPLHQIQGRKVKAYVCAGYRGPGWTQPLFVLETNEDDALAIITLAHHGNHSVRLCADEAGARSFALSVTMTGDWGE